MAAVGITTFYGVHAFVLGAISSAAQAALVMPNRPLGTRARLCRSLR